MKVAVVNLSGNVGKTTVARHLLAPRLGSPAEIAVESANARGDEAETLRGRQFGELHEILSLVECAVVDVGASNAEDFLNRMAQYEGSHEEFDYFVVPVSPKEKPRRDTPPPSRSWPAWASPPARSACCSTWSKAAFDPRHVFPGLFAYQADTRKFTLNPAAAIHENELSGA